MSFSKGRLILRLPFLYVNIDIIVIDLCRFYVDLIFVTY